ncbi:hypothetical protein K9M50_03745 [Patescibacteria group bacterium]|nr:hypothetical protein [Patescibacteria group bacterium]
MFCNYIKARKELFFKILESNNYQCFSRDSYACFRRRDIEDTNDLSNKDQPVGKLNKIDIKKAFKIIKKVCYGAGDMYQMATVIREWKKIR